MELQKGLFHPESPGLKSREEKMPGAIPYSGLCANCQNASECTFPRLPGRPVRQCEEFKGIESGGERNPCEGSFPLHSGFDADEIDYRTKTGLCANCANRKICTFSKPESGVWHCEEYR